MLEKPERAFHNLKTAHSTSQAQVTEMQQHLESERQRNQTRNAENTTLEAQVTEIQQQLDANKRKSLQ
jgi:cell division protein FtsB